MVESSKKAVGTSKGVKGKKGVSKGVKKGTKAGSAPAKKSDPVKEVTK